MDSHLLIARINKLPKCARDYIHHVKTFVGAEEVEEIFFLRDQNKALVKLVAELKHGDCEKAGKEVLKRFIGLAGLVRHLHRTRSR